MLNINIASKRKLFHFASMPLISLLKINIGLISIECYLIVALNLVVFEYLRKIYSNKLFKSINTFY